MRFGGTLTLISLIMYIAYNLEKVLLGRFWGAAAVGIYGRAYQIINIPTENLNSAVGEVAFASLSRVQKDPVRFRNYFLKGYSLVLALTVPITIAVALFAHDLIRVLLGPKWAEAAEISRFLAPTILVFAIINPVGWLIFSLGMVGRSLKASMVFAPMVIGAYALGLPYGPKGVALAYSAVLILWAIPLVAWGVYCTAISLWDVLAATKRPLSSGIVAGAIAYLVQLYAGQTLSPLLRLMMESTVLVSAYVGMLLFVMGQKTIYWDLLQSFRKRSAGEDSTIPA
jgi:PST family polysaccharide transporter